MCWKTFMSTNTTSTNDRAAPDGPGLAPADNTGVPLNEKVAAAMASLPDVAVIARLANELFAALPGAAVPQAGAEAEPGIAPPMADAAGLTSGVPNVMPPADIPGLSQPASSQPDPALPGAAAFYFLDAEKVASRSTAPVFPPVMDVFSFPGVPGFQAVPLPPVMPSSPPAEADLSTLTSVPTGAPAVLTETPGFALPAESPGSLGYFFQEGATAPWSASPAGPTVPVASELFSFPGIPDLQASPPSATTVASEPGSVGAVSVAEPSVLAPTTVAKEEKAAIWSAPAAFPPASEILSFPAVPSMQSPAIPSEAATDSPVTVSPPADDELRALPASLGLGTALSTHFPNAEPSSPLPGSSAYFLHARETASKAAALNFPAPTQMFSFPGAPGAQSMPGLPPLPSSPPAEVGLGSLPASSPGTTAPKSFSSVTQSKEPSSWPGFGDKPEKPAPASAAQPARPASLDFRPGLVAALASGSSYRVFDAEAIRRDFPILREQVHGRPLIWLDNAATTQKPQSVIDRVSHFYEHENSNIHRAAHTLAARATDAYESAREKVRRFLNAPSTREIVFVRGATEAINLAAQSWGRRHVGKDDEIVITWLEHHSNIVPWQMLCAEKGARLRVAPIDDDGQILLDEFEKLLGPKTRLVSITQVSNALGTMLPIKKMVEIAHRYGARVLIDGAQALAHIRTDVQALDCDFYAFSGHKIFAPTGIGVLYGKPDALAESPPWQGGGSMIVDVTFEKTVYQTPPARFEAGTGNIADAVGLGAALDYLEQIGMENIARYEHELLEYGTTQLRTVPGLRLIGTAKEKAGVMSFVLDGYRTEDVGAALDREGIAVRAGHHCAQPTLRRFGLETTVRPSLALYNTRADIDALIAALHKLAVWNHKGPARVR